MVMVEAYLVIFGLYASLAGMFVLAIIDTGPIGKNIKPGESSVYPKRFALFIWLDIFRAFCTALLLATFGGLLAAFSGSECLFWNTWICSFLLGLLISLLLWLQRRCPKCGGFWQQTVIRVDEKAHRHYDYERGVYYLRYNGRSCTRCACGHHFGYSPFIITKDEKDECRSVATR